MPYRAELSTLRARVERLEHDLKARDAWLKYASEEKRLLQAELQKSHRAARSGYAYGTLYLSLVGVVLTVLGHYELGAGSMVLALFVCAPALQDAKRRLDDGAKTISLAGIVVAFLGLPLAAFMWLLTGLNFAHGRPLRVGGRRLKVRPRRAACGRTTVGLRGRLLRRLWLRSASDEQASAPAFEHLSQKLRVLRAPEHLIARTERAANEEREHARRCLALAKRYGGEDYTVPDVDAPPPPTSVDIDELAVEQLVDGCLGEGYAAAVLAAGAKRAHDRDVRHHLKAIAREEASHAALSWDVLNYLLSRSDVSLRRSLVRRARRHSVAPFARPLQTYAFDLSPDGFVPRAEEQRLYRRVHQTLLHRLTP